MLVHDEGSGTGGIRFRSTVEFKANRVAIGGLSELLLTSISMEYEDTTQAGTSMDAVPSMTTGEEFVRWKVWSAAPLS